MKIKSALILGLLFYAVTSYSQSDSSSRFPHSKTFMLEINFNPFGTNGVFSFDNLQTKYWINDKTALRLGFQFDYKNNSKTDDDYNSSEEYKPTFSEKSLLFGFKPGIEFRILENSKISPYWGVEFSFINKSSKSEYVDYYRVYDYSNSSYSYEKLETNVEGAWRDTEDYYEYLSFNNERAYHAFGANVLLGADYFFVKNIYLGFEIGLGYEMLKYKQAEAKFDGLASYTGMGIPIDNVFYPSSKSTDFGFYYNNSIRLGIYF